MGLDRVGGDCEGGFGGQSSKASIRSQTLLVQKT